VAKALAAPTGWGQKAPKKQAFSSSLWRLTHLALNVPTVVHETIEGETIVIHMGSGTYYSLEDGASELWSLIERGLDRPRLLEYSRERWDGEPNEIEAGVSELLDQLLDEGLVVEIAGQNGAASAAVPPTPARTPFAPPLLQRFTDMQEFMLVDPLHDVDAAAGWPHVRPE
jgi:hypothetical protein